MKSYIVSSSNHKWPTISQSWVIAVFKTFSCTTYTTLKTKTNTVMKQNDKWINNIHDSFWFLYLLLSLLKYFVDIRLPFILVVFLASSSVPTFQLFNCACRPSKKIFWTTIDVSANYHLVHRNFENCLSAIPRKNQQSFPVVKYVVVGHLNFSLLMIFLKPPLLRIK